MNDFEVTPDLLTSRGNRFLHYIVDLIVIMLVLAGLFLGFLFLYYTLADDTTVMDDFLDATENINPLLDRLITAFVLALVYFAMESLTKGRSIGKYITKTKVVMEDGAAPSGLDYLKRSFSRVIPFEQFSFLGASGRGWHDTISKTYVVDIDKFEAKKKALVELEQIGLQESAD